MRGLSKNCGRPIKGWVIFIEPWRFACSSWNSEEMFDTVYTNRIIPLHRSLLLGHEPSGDIIITTLVCRKRFIKWVEKSFSLATCHSAFFIFFPLTVSYLATVVILRCRITPESSEKTFSDEKGSFLCLLCYFHASFINVQWRPLFSIMVHSLGIGLKEKSSSWIHKQ